MHQYAVNNGVTQMDAKCTIDLPPPSLMPMPETMYCSCAMIEAVCVLVVHMSLWYLWGKTGGPHSSLLHNNNQQQSTATTPAVYVDWVSIAWQGVPRYSCPLLLMAYRLLNFSRGIWRLATTIPRLFGVSGTVLSHLL